MENNEKHQYDIVIDYIKNKIITDQTWKEGMRIPAERKLQTCLEVSRNTIRKAISILINEGYLFSEIGRGTYVNSRQHWENKKFDPNKSKLIGTIITDIKLDFGKKIIRGVEDYLQKRKYSMILCQDHGDIRKTMKYIDTLTRLKVQGVILDPILTKNYKRDNEIILKALQDAGIAVVTIDRELEQNNNPAIVTDNEIISGKAADYLIKNNHRNIIIIRDISEVTGKRLSGVKTAFETRRIPFENCNIVNINDDNSDDEITKLIAAQISADDKATAVFSLSEYCGKLTYRALMELSRQVPEDYSFITFDHPEDSHFQKGHICYIEQPLIRMGNKAAELIISVIENGRPEAPLRAVISSTLVEGNSVITL